MSLPGMKLSIIAATIITSGTRKIYKFIKFALEIRFYPSILSCETPLAPFKNPCVLEGLRCKRLTT